MYRIVCVHIGFMGLRAAFEDTRWAEKAGAVLALAGVVIIPIIYFSVAWWNTLHEDALPGVVASTAAVGIVFAAMVVTAIGFWMYGVTVALMRARCVILESERDSDWVIQ